MDLCICATEIAPDYFYITENIGPFGPLVKEDYIFATNREEAIQEFIPVPWTEIK